MKKDQFARGQLWVCTAGGRALVQEVGEEGGIHEDLVLASFLGTKKARWVDPRQMFRTIGQMEWKLEVGA